MLPKRDFEIIFVDLDEKAIAALRQAFAGMASIKYNRANIGQVRDYARPVCVAAAGNSFAMMDGGVDGAINCLLSSVDESIEQRCQDAIDERYGGEQPVGTSLIIPACNESYDYLAYIPTMTIPENVQKTRNPYLAFRALLVDVVTFNKSAEHPIRCVITTGLCTGAGNVCFQESARQMRLAYETVFEHRVKHRWHDVWEMQHRLIANPSFKGFTDDSPKNIIVQNESSHD